MGNSVNASAWKLQGHRARLSLEPLRAVVDATQPASGLVEIGVGEASLTDAQLLGVLLPAFRREDTETIVEFHSRGADLVAAYDATPDRPMRVDLLWHVFAPDDPAGPIAVVDLVVSVRTLLLRSQPRVAVQSKLPTRDAQRLVDAESNHFQPLGVDPVAATTVLPGDGTGCILFRLPGEEFSYAEMVHPTDFLHDELCGAVADDPVCTLRHDLFPERLEKGVIRRARVRGLLVPRDDDTRLAAESYLEFASTEPPLGT